MNHYFNIIEHPLKFILTPDEKRVNLPLCGMVKERNQNDKGQTFSRKKGKSIPQGSDKAAKNSEIKRVSQKRNDVTDVC